ncbi:MAG: phospholipase D family protein, partial [Candidatus Eremiobacterota bacterium]
DELRSEENVVVQRRGLLDLLESQTSVPPRGGLSTEDRVDRAVESAAFSGLKASDLAEIPDKDGDGRVSPAEERAFLISGEGAVRLTERGRHALADGLEGAVERMNGKANMQRLSRSEPPSDRQVGSDTVAVGDTSAERQALVLHAIDSADRFIKVSAFVMNEDMARLLAEKKERMEAQGKPFEVQVVLDPSLYGYGGTPNEKSFRLLEDRGVPVKWATLERTDPDHDRKVHAKLIVTDQMMLTGSTNFSKKGLRDNWEASEVVYFGEDDQSKARLAEVTGDFDRLYQRESLSLDTRSLADQRYGDRQGAEGEYLRDTYRTRVTRSFLRGIRDYEKEIGQTIQERVASDPSVQFEVNQRVNAGQARGYAILGVLGQEEVARMREDSPAWRRLQQIREQGAGG